MTNLRHPKQPSHILKGHIVTFKEISGSTSILEHQIELQSTPSSLLVIGLDGKIIWRGLASSLPGSYQDLPCTDYGEHLILPGFIDTHIHFPQYRLLAAPGDDLLDWLTRYTFPEEEKYSDPQFAQQAAQKFLSLLFSHGTTSAVAYCSVHPQSVDALFSAAQQKNMQLITGKTLMDRLAPETLLDTPQLAYDQSTSLIQKWHHVDRLKYAITPRFALTSTESQLEVVRELFQKNPTSYLQSHLSESIGEVRQISALFPKAENYTHVYATHDLLGPRALYGHAIHLSEAECAMLSDSKTAVIHCPTSNMFLGSGLFDMAHIARQNRPIPVGLATDIGAGTHYSMFQTMGSAYKTALLQGVKLDSTTLYYMATAGNAKILGLDHEIGLLDPGQYADLIIVDPAVTLLQKERHHLSSSLDDILFYLMHLGDERNIHRTYISGKPVS